MAHGVVLVPGTWSWHPQATGEWYQAPGEFVKFLTDQGIRVWSANRPFVWTGRVAGVFWQKCKFLDWEAAAANLQIYMDPNVPEIGLDCFRPEIRQIIAHSHGGQIALIAAANGMKLKTLVTVATPVRDDMLEIAAAAKHNIDEWVHIHSDWSDRMQMYGELFDGHFGIRRSFPIPGVQNIGIPEIGHSKILRDPAYFGYWLATGALEFLRRPS